MESGCTRSGCDKRQRSHLLYGTRPLIRICLKSCWISLVQKSLEKLEAPFLFSVPPTNLHKETLEALEETSVSSHLSHQCLQMCHHPQECQVSLCHSCGGAASTSSEGQWPSQLLLPPLLFCQCWGTEPRALGVLVKCSTTKLCPPTHTCNSDRDLSRSQDLYRLTKCREVTEHTDTSRFYIFLIYSSSLKEKLGFFFSIVTLVWISHRNAYVEMARGLKALVPLPKDLGSTPTTHTAAHTSQILVLGVPTPFSVLHGCQAHAWYTDTHARNTPIHIKSLCKCLCNRCVWTSVHDQPDGFRQLQDGENSTMVACSYPGTSVNREMVFIQWTVMSSLSRLLPFLCPSAQPVRLRAGALPSELSLKKPPTPKLMFETDHCTNPSSWATLRDRSRTIRRREGRL